jgi:hypothetical protein
MVRTFCWLSLTLVPVAAALIYIAGCNAPSDTTSPPTHDAKASGDNKGDAHGHKPGAHGGTIVEVGRDNYHAEAIFEKAGVVRLYMLGKDEARVLEVESQELTAFAKPDGGTESATFTFKAQPQPGDAAGKTSQFAGTLPSELHGKRVDVTVPSIRIDGERFRFGFTSHVDAHDGGTPDPAEENAVRARYLTPAGIYTAADIKANGTAPGSEKYKGMVSSHNKKPALGDKICPESGTKANPQFTWVVGGKTYEFCCPPCIDEFVQKAREHPELIKEPGEYVKKK